MGPLGECVRERGPWGGEWGAEEHLETHLESLALLVRNLLRVENLAIALHGEVVDVPVRPTLQPAGSMGTKPLRQSRSIIHHSTLHGATGPVRRITHAKRRCRRTWPGAPPRLSSPGWQQTQPWPPLSSQRAACGSAASPSSPCYEARASSCG